MDKSTAQKELQSQKEYKVCSNPFECERPTEEYPNPKLFLKGYDYKRTTENSRKRKAPKDRLPVLPIKMINTNAPMPCSDTNVQNSDTDIQDLPTYLDSVYIPLESDLTIPHSTDQADIPQVKQS